MNNTPPKPRISLLERLTILSFAFICLITMCVASQATRAMGVQADEQKALRTDGNRTPLGFAADSKSAFFLNAINYDAVVEEIEFETGATKQLKFCKGAMLIDGTHYLSQGREWLTVSQPSCSRLELFDLTKQKRKDLLLEPVFYYDVSPSGTLLLNGDKIQKITPTGLVDLKKLDRHGIGMFRSDENQLLIVSSPKDRQSVTMSFYSVPNFDKIRELVISSIKGVTRPIFWLGDSIVLLAPGPGLSAPEPRMGYKYFDCTFSKNADEQPTIKLIGNGSGPWNTFWTTGYIDQWRFGTSWYARVTSKPNLAPEMAQRPRLQHQPAFKLEIFDRKTDESLYVMTRDKPCHVIISPDGKRLIEQTSNTEFRFHDLHSKQSVTRVVSRK